MEYSFLIGLFYNFDLSVYEYIYLLVGVIFSIISINTLIFYSNKEKKRRIIFSLLFMFFCILTMGIIGFVSAVIISIVSFAFFDEFGRD